MAASDQTYRNQRKLDLVFGISAFLMLIAIVIMFAQDYFQPWKTEQRTFRDVDEGITLNLMLDEASTALTDWQGAEEKAYEAREILDAVKSKDPEKKAQAAFDNADKERAGIKAIYDSKVSLRNIAKDNHDSSLQSLESEVASLRKKLDQAEQTVEDKNKDLIDARAGTVKVKVTVGKEKKEVETSLKQAKSDLDDAEAALKKKTGKLDNLAKAVANKKWGLGDFIRRLPIIDGFNSSLKINQITLEGYPIDYSFKRVTRYDRCTTCHLGIDQEKFDHASLVALKDAKGKKDVLKDLRKHYETRADHGETLGFNWKDLPTEAVHVKLSDGQVRQFEAHPRLDMFLDAKSPHPIEKFGCTACHAGQGSSTTFNNASHVPNDAVEKKRWGKDHGWEMTHSGDWEYPMLAHRFVESSCLKCHHQVTDTVSYGSREEAPKLLRGYNLIKEFGCYGCHEIAGYKQGQEIGPDLRLELSPPIESLPPGEREKLLSDRTNPPGNLRKVGPSLYRLSEKTDPEWVARWVRDPRGFRPDTKMPHFYGLSNNDKEALKGTGQEAFPDMEVRAIAYYLMDESKQYLSNKDGTYHDIYHRLYEIRRKELEKKKADLKKEDRELSDKEKQELDDVTERLDAAKQKERSPSLQLQASPQRVTDQIIDGKGSLVKDSDIPVEAKNDTERGEGGRLFRDRGCLACHTHEATNRKDTDPKGTVPAIEGSATFGPNLTRIREKVAKSGNDRRWLIQWILNPNVHNPRTRMPITHLTPSQAAHIADWLLSRDMAKSTDWAEVASEKDIKVSELSDLVRVYLAKAPDMTRRKVDSALKTKGDDAIAGFSDKEASDLKWSADERRLEAKGDGGVGKDDMLWYVGRKAVSRYGCYACHDIPGFETSKPIGTPLNDWGKKDAERLAFEDSVAFVKEHHGGGVVQRLRDAEGNIVAKAGGKPLYEQFYLDALEHHQRDGFLHQKLNEPRSFDYSRKLAWDDRLRMPQFRFARDAARHKDDDPVKAAVEEVEAREAVMTFVLGLVAEPVPNAYTPHPDTDRQAEIKGRQVLDKFNCAGCHMIRAGVYDFKLTDDAREELASSYKAAKSEIDAGYDEFYKNHNAWTGAEQKRTDRLRVFGLQWNRDKGKLRPTQAVRFEDKDNGVRNIPSGTLLSLPADSLMQLTSQAGPLDPTPYGGYFGDLLMGDGGPGSYMNSHPNLPSGPAEEVRRAVLPPPLHREGEKVQPGWLQRFLRDPKPIRPPERMLLRMPKFNMSDEEIDAIVRYFIAVDRLENPGASTTNAWLPPEQLNVEFWQKRNAEYLKKLGDKLKKREEDETLQDPLKNFIEFRIVPEIPGLLEQKKAQVLVQEDVIKKLKDDKTASDKDKEAAETKLKQLKDEQKSLEERVNDLKKDPDKAREAETKKALPEYVQRWKSNETYATDAYHLLVSRSTKDTTCLKCHNIAENEASDRQGPTLFFRKDQMLFQTAAGGSQQSEGEAYIASERLRPEWVQRWVAQPKRLHGYDTPMVQVFLKDPTDLQKRLFEADDKADPTKAQADRITALRDVLMNTPPVADLPPNRFYRPKIEGQK